MDSPGLEDPYLRREYSNARGCAQSRPRTQQPYQISNRQPCPSSRSSPAQVGTNTYLQESASFHQDYRTPVPESRRQGVDDTTLPKHFSKPLTCFFWHHNGRCNKSDEDCAYAHWDTGFVAGAPLTFTTINGPESVAGRRAQIYRTGSLKVSKPSLQTREEALEVKEENITTRLDVVTRREKDLEKRIRLQEKEFKLREKRITRKEQALAQAESACWTCEKCGHQD